MSDLPDELLVKHCSPTLAGMKTGSIFTYAFCDLAALRDTVRRLNRRFVSKGVRVLPLRYENHRALIYLYRLSKLSVDLQHPVAQRILNECGYTQTTPQRLIRHLMKRLKEQRAFPHEIGLFLGYPPEDVWGFIHHRAQAYLCVGCWKVYHNAAQAKKTFAQYKKCTGAYCRRYTQGVSVERLTVAAV